MRTPATRLDPAAAGFPGWPSNYEGRPLTPLPLSSREQEFARDFPGLVGRFSDGTREVIVRYVSEPTRHLHPAADCLRGAGYRVTPRPARRDAFGNVMSCQVAVRDGNALNVCEVIRNERGRSWPRASSWYWSAVMGTELGPWWSYVVYEPAKTGD